MTTEGVRWSRLAAEGIVIVVSVFLALAADAAWAAVQSRQTARQELRTVLEELKDRRQSLERGQRLHERALAGSTALLQQLVAVDEGAPLHVSDTLASQLHWVTVSAPSSPVLEGFVQAGHIQHLKNSYIGPALLRWEARVEDMSSDEARTARLIDDQVVPYLVQEFDYVGARDVPPGGPPTISGAVVGITQLRSTRQLRDLVAGQISFLTLLTRQSSRAMPALDSLIGQIEMELR